MEKQLRDVKLENKKLVEPLQKSQIAISDLTVKMDNYDKDKQILSVSKCVL